MSNEQVSSESVLASQSEGLFQSIVVRNVSHKIPSRRRDGWPDKSIHPHGRDMADQGASPDDTCCRVFTGESVHLARAAPECAGQGHRGVEICNGRVGR